MKTVRQVVERTSAQEGPKKAGAEYAVQNDRAEFLAGRGFVEIVGDAPDAAPAPETVAPAAKASAKKPAAKKAARKGKG